MAKQPTQGRKPDLIPTALDQVLASAVQTRIALRRMQGHAR